MPLVHRALVALLLVTASPAPAPVQPMTLAGITLGQSDAEVRAILGEPNDRSTSLGVDWWEYKRDGGGTQLVVALSANRVVSIIATEADQGRSSVVDPAGIKIGDPAERIAHIKGTPDRDSNGRLTYLMPDGGFWAYQTEQDVPDPCDLSKGPRHVGMISVSTGWYGVSISLISSRGNSGWSEQTLAGISLGETKTDVRRRLGPPTSDERLTGADKNVYAIANGDMMYVDYDGSGKVSQVEMSCLCDGKMHVPVDAYGVGLPDDLATLIRLRGRPLEEHDVAVGPHVVVYGAGADAKWTFALYQNHMSSITLAKNK